MLNMSRMNKSMTDTHQQFIEKKRAEIVTELGEYLKEIGHDMTVSDVVAAIFNDDNDEDFEEYVMMITGDDPGSVEQAQELMMELFNYFPRQTLGGKSLAEKMPFDELQKMEQAFNNGESYSYTLPEEKWRE